MSQVVLVISDQQISLKSCVHVTKNGQLFVCLFLHETFLQGISWLGLDYYFKELFFFKQLSWPK